MNLELSMIPKSGVISTNFEEIKEKLEEEMSTYKTMRVTVDNKKEAKGDMADLRKLKKKLNDRKKEVKEEYMKPYLEVEDGVKQLISINGALVLRVFHRWLVLVSGRPLPVSMRT